MSATDSFTTARPSTTATTRAEDTSVLPTPLVIILGINLIAALGELMSGFDLSAFPMQ